MCQLLIGTPVAVQEIRNRLWAVNQSIGHIFEGILMSPIRMSRLESSTRIIIKFIEDFNRQNITGMMQLIGNECVFENAGPVPDDAVYSGKETITAFWQDFFYEAPQSHIDIEEIFGMGFRCVTRWKYNRDNQKEKNNYIRGVTLFKVKNGSITEILSYVKAQCGDK
ncbi:nuclear transport factor 2 family protein [candidate division KSB1 bacterium]|nr:nuclear transport factor 2 family protein [candidate division KSB1 bacterium]